MLVVEQLRCLLGGHGLGLSKAAYHILT
jgi:hypothetical protein